MTPIYRGVNRLVDICTKKRKGTWGEAYLDRWFALQGWSIVKANLRVWKGEIDRVYARNSKHRALDYCVVEVKTRLVPCKQDARSLNTENGLSQLMRPSQMQAMDRMANALMQQKPGSTAHIRLMIVLIYKNKTDKTAIDLDAMDPIKVLVDDKGVGLFAVKPEYCIGRAAGKIEGIRRL